MITNIYIMNYKFKRILSFLLFLCIIFTANITSFAKDTPNVKKIKEQINGAAAYLTNDIESYGVNDAVDFCILAGSGADVSEFSKSFLSDVKANLDRNGGKIVSSYGENLTTYAAVIIALISLGENPADFNGCDITKIFIKTDPSADIITPNYYRIVIQAALCCKNSEKFLQALCDAYIGKYYKAGKGVDYFGFSCDNTAYFIDAVCNSGIRLEKYKKVINDAIEVLESYRVDGGYCFNPKYDTKPNADSTALALMAQSSYTACFGNTEKSSAVLNGIYEELCAFEGSDTGVFTYNNADSPYATRDALMALSRYYSVMPKHTDLLNQSFVFAIIIIFSTVCAIVLAGILLLLRKKKKNKTL